MRTMRCIDHGNVIGIEAVASQAGSGSHLNENAML